METTKAVSVLTDEIFKAYGDKAKSLASQLSQFPSRDKVDNYKIMSDVATCLFIKAEAAMHEGKTNEAIAQFKNIITQYPWSSLLIPAAAVIGLWRKSPRPVLMSWKAKRKQRPL